MSFCIYNSSNIHTKKGEGKGQAQIKLWFSVKLILKLSLNEFIQQKRLEKEGV